MADLPELKLNALAEMDLPTEQNLIGDKENALVPYADYPIGSMTSNALPIPDTATLVTLSIPRNSPGYSDCWTSNSAQVQLKCEVTLNGGVTWQSIGGLKSSGGQASSRYGIAMATSTKIPLPTGSSRLARIVNTISGAAVRSSFGMAFS